jgi:integrase
VTEAAIVEGRHFKVIEAKRHTLADLIDRYIREILPHKGHSSIYMQTLQLTWWKAQLGHCVLADLTPALIAEYRDKIALGNETPRANSTVNRYLAALSHAFTVAVKEWGWLDDSPMRKVRKPKEPRGRVRYLSDDERQRLLAECKASRNPHLYTVVVLALSTGARSMEILSLRWHDIDFQRHVITLHHTKNGARRVLPLAGLAFDLICHHAQNRRTDTELVFPRARGTKPMSIREAWEYAVKRAGIENFRFHDLRHTFASYLAMNGASLLEIAEALGRKTLSMVKRYAHLSEAHTAGVVARMNQAIFGQ